MIHELQEGCPRLGSKCRFEALPSTQRVATNHGAMPKVVLAFASHFECVNGFKMHISCLGGIPALGHSHIEA